MKKGNAATAEFKVKVGLEAVRAVKTTNEIRPAYGIHPAAAGLWKKEILERAKTLFEGKRGPKPVATRQELDRRHGEIGKLKVELDGRKISPGSVYRDAPTLD